MAEADLWFALEKVSLSLKDAAVLLRANHLGVGYEAAAVFAYKEKSQMKKKQLTVNKIVESVTSDDLSTFTTLTGHVFLLFIIKLSNTMSQGQASLYGFVCLQRKLIQHNCSHVICLIYNS